MKKLMMLSLLLGSFSTFASEITEQAKIEKVLARFPEITNQVLAKSVSRGKLIMVTKLVTQNTGNVWDSNGSGYDCQLTIEAFSSEQHVGELSKTYSDADCPQL